MVQENTVCIRSFTYPCPLESCTAGPVPSWRSQQCGSTKPGCVESCPMPPALPAGSARPTGCPSHKHFYMSPETRFSLPPELVPQGGPFLFGLANSSSSFQALLTSERCFSSCVQQQLIPRLSFLPDCEIWQDRIYVSSLFKCNFNLHQSPILFMYICVYVCVCNIHTCFLKVCLWVCILFKVKQHCKAYKETLCHPFSFQQLLPGVRH